MSRDDDGLCSHCGAPLYPSERCDCWDRPTPSTPSPKEAQMSAEKPWIEWNGGKRPVQAYTLVQVRHRDGWEDVPAGRHAKDWAWKLKKAESKADIIAYRVASQ